MRDKDLLKRLRLFREFIGFSDGEKGIIADKLPSFSRKNYLQIERGDRGINTNLINELIINYDLNPTWFYTGMGDMKIMQRRNKKRRKDLDDNFPVSLKGEGRIFEINDSLSSNHFSYGDFLICEKGIKPKYAISEELYVLMTKEEGLIIKQIINNEDKKSLILNDLDNTVLPLLKNYNKIIKLWQIVYLITGNILK